ncbi:MAG: M24 family metallopeptidase [Acidimicrobiales bacterium]
MTSTTRPSPDPEAGSIDLDRLRSDRRARCLHEMKVDGLDAVLLGDEANARYASGARRLWLAGTRPFVPSCVVMADTGGIHLMTTSDDGVPEDIPRPNLFGAPWNPAGFTTALRAIPGLGRAGRIGIDGMTPTMATLLARALPSAEVVDAGPALARARRIKTPDELVCLGVALAAAEGALAHALAHLRPGVTEQALYGHFAQGLGDYGLTIPSVQAGFCVTPRHGADPAPGPRRMSANRVVNATDLVSCDVGVYYQGYEGTLARTWPCEGADGGELSDPQRSLHHRWTEAFNAALSACQPGRAAGDVLDAYRQSGEPLPAMPVLTGLGLGVETPVVGQGIPPDAGASSILEAGMVITLGAYVHEEGVGGYLGREAVVIRDDGPHLLTRHSYGPLARP